MLVVEPWTSATLPDARGHCAGRVLGGAAPEAARDGSIAAGLMDAGKMGFLLVPIPTASLMGATSMAVRQGALHLAWLARAGLALSIVMVDFGVVGLLPSVKFALLGLWLAAVPFALNFRTVPGQVLTSLSPPRPTSCGDGDRRTDDDAPTRRQHPE